MKINDEQLKQEFHNETQLQAKDNLRLYFQWIQIKQLDNLTKLSIAIQNDIAKYINSHR